jgi:hypothetical protein
MAAVSNILKGAGSVLDIWPAPHRRVVGRKIRALSPAEALASDWNRVGSALRASMTVVSREVQGHGHKGNGSRAIDAPEDPRQFHLFDRPED